MADQVQTAETGGGEGSVPTAVPVSVEVKAGEPVKAEAVAKTEESKPQQPKDEAKPVEDKVEAKRETKVETQPEVQAEIQSEAKVETQLEAKVETQPKAKVEIQPEPKAETQPEPKAETQPEPKAETQPEPKIESQPETKIESQPETKIESQPETKIESQPETKVETQLETKVESQPEAKVETQLEVKPETTEELKADEKPKEEAVDEAKPGPSAPQQNGDQPDWQQRELELLKKIEELENVKNLTTEEGLKYELKIRDQEIDLLKARVKNLETELQAALSKPSGKNHEMIQNIKQQHEELLSKARGMIFDKTKMVKNQELQIEALNNQVTSLKDINQITKDLLEIRNSEVKAMEDRLQVMEAKFKVEKDRYSLVLQRAQNSTSINDDLKKEYETQLAIFKELRQKYEQRVQALVNENTQLKELAAARAQAASTTGSLPGPGPAGPTP